jgi:secretion/DNA translocation related TadE-like protein
MAAPSAASCVSANTPDSDRGAAGIWVLCVYAGTLTFVVSMLAWGVALGSRHRAVTAADLSALAAAERLLDGNGQPCAVARRVASAQGARLSQCVVEAQTVLVVAEVAGSIGRLVLPTARARARAGAGSERGSGSSKGSTSTRPP